MKKLALTFVAAGVAAVLVACGGGGDSAPTAVAKDDVTVPAKAETTAAVVNTPFSFNSGVPEFGTTTPTTLSFTSTSTTPAFSIAADGKTATGTTTFGSCIFTITQSTFSPPSPLAVGGTIRVNPCNIKVDSDGAPANGEGQSRSVALQLGTAASTETPITVSITPGGQVTLNGRTLGSVTLAPVTGG